MSTILVTGAGGFVGSLTCRKLLDKGYKVRAVDNFYRGNCDSLITLCNHSNFEFYYCDVADSEISKQVKNIDGIIHLAALVGAPVCNKHKALANVVNVGGTKNISWAAPKDIPIIFSSTGSVYGKVEDICTEESPTNALSVYGVTKIEAEKILLERENSIIYRFATGYGCSPNIRVDLLVNDLVYQACTNRNIVIFQADFKRTFIHVEDMADALIFGLENYEKMPEKVYNVGTEKGNWTKRQLAEFIREKTNCLVVYADEGYVDPDQRDYETSTKLIESKGWFAKRDLDESIEELIKVNSILYNNHQYTSAF